MIRAVLFDMDGLLLDTERVAMQTYQTVAKDLGLDFDLEGFRQLVGLNAKSGIEMFRKVFPTADHKTFNQAWNREYERLLVTDIPIRPMVREVLALIDLPKAVVTSSKRSNALKKLDATGLLHHFEHVVGGDDVANGKPHPEPYQTGARKLGLAAQDCVAFEDSENGTRSAYAAGCRTIQIPDIFAPTEAFMAHGHTIADDLMVGARLAGLIK